MSSYFSCIYSNRIRKQFHIAQAPHTNKIKPLLFIGIFMIIADMDKRLTFNNFIILIKPYITA